jgi:hypothetical protein
MKSNHEDHEEHKSKIEIMTLWFLLKLRALRGETIFLPQNLQFCIQRDQAPNSNPK